MKTIIHILHLEDNPADAELVEATLLKDGLDCHITKVQTEDEFRAALEDGKIELILADYSLPTYDGMSALHLAQDYCQDIPFVFVSGAMGEDAAIEALTQGATDYVLKHKLIRLVPAVLRAMKEARIRLERKLLEKDLYRLNQDLEKRVFQRTQELEASHADLEKAYEELKIAHSRMLQQDKMAAIGQLAAGIAHEINNPLSFIISNLDALLDYIKELNEFHHKCGTMLKECVAASPADDRLTEIVRLQKDMDIDFILEDIKEMSIESLEGGERIKQIVESLKDFARPGGQGQKSVNLNDGLESTLKIAWNELTHKAKVITSYGDLPPIVCNPGQMNQMFMNLLLNAAQAIEDQGEINIATRKEDGFIVIEISDTGCGIPAENVNRIFDPFFTTRPVGQGTGLGLSIVYDIVKKHKGEITVDSSPGQGARFSIRLPIRNGQ